MPSELARRQSYTLLPRKGLRVRTPRHAPTFPQTEKYLSERGSIDVIEATVGLLRQVVTLVVR